MGSMQVAQLLDVASSVGLRRKNTQGREEAAAGKPSLELSGVSTPVTSHDGVMVALTNEKQSRLVEIQWGSEPTIFSLKLNRGTPEGHQLVQPVTHLSRLCDSLLLYSVGARLGSVKLEAQSSLWKTRGKEEEELSYPLHVGPITALECHTRQPGMVLTAGVDGQVHVLNLEEAAVPASRNDLFRVRRSCHIGSHVTSAHWWYPHETSHISLTTASGHFQIIDMRAENHEALAANLPSPSGGASYLCHVLSGNDVLLGDSAGNMQAIDIRVMAPWSTMVDPFIGSCEHITVVSAGERMSWLSGGKRGVSYWTKENALNGDEGVFRCAFGVHSLPTAASSARSPGPLFLQPGIEKPKAAFSFDSQGMLLEYGADFTSSSPLVPGNADDLDFFMMQRSS